MTMTSTVRRFVFFTTGTLALCFSSYPLLTGKSAQHSYVPKAGFVPDEKTAVRVAEAVLVPIYGEEQVTSERPFVATLNEKGDKWTVYGTLPVQYNKGGVATVEIVKADGRIVRVTHGK
jgi:hypothetical protein